MRLRSLLFVPGDRPERMEKAILLDADALILDLEDAVAPTRKDAARAAVAAFLDVQRDCTMRLIVRINPLDSPYLAEDLMLVAAHRPNGIVLPKAEGAASISALLERQVDLPPILPIATETPRSIFQLGSYGDTAAHLLGLTWGAEDLPAAIGATASRDEGGLLLPPYEMVRALTLFAAHAAGVPAIETVYPDLADLDGLAAYAARAARDGFTGMMAVHPAQLPVINAAFTPTEAQIAHARRVVAAFAAHPDEGVVRLDDKMMDAPHLKQARRILGLAEE